MLVHTFSKMKLNFSEIYCPVLKLAVNFPLIAYFED